MIDSHTHSFHSHDGQTSISNLVKRAAELKMEYIAITEHFDKDYKFGNSERFCRQLNLKGYKRAFDKVKSRYDGDTYVAFGIELGYDKRLEDYYDRVLKEYDFDVVINSVHTLGGIEAYYGNIFKNTTQDEVYFRYLDTLIDSVNAKYNFNIISHIGYVTRYAKYENNLLWQDRFKSKIDDLLKLIIEKDKTLEINTHVSKNGLEFLPETDILKRYVALGGSNVTFSSDAHKAKFVADKYQLARDFCHEIGLKEWTIYKKGVPYKIGID